MSSQLEAEIKRRRTFAIISHPDAGKTTITEKILYHGGVIRQAGEVKGKAGSKKATSDWMKMEQERGVSITSSVMQFDYAGLRVNLLDTPGHKDFSEDTYRTLVAADCSAMLIDAAKGVEAQTKKLYEVCKLKQLPIFTFANKVDREGKSPLEIIDDVENTLGISCYPVTWPIGMGGLFRGLFHRLDNKVYLYAKGIEVPQIYQVQNYQDPKITELVGEELHNALVEELELLEGIIGDFDLEFFLEGEISPLSFGSAKYNWGIDLFLDLFAKYAPEPQSWQSGDRTVQPTDSFSAFVFKIQANMDKRHRDRVTFLRVCSGKFERGMKAGHSRLGRELRLAYANQFLAQDRETVDVAYAGDIVGVNDSGNFQIGDTLSAKGDLSFKGIPRFSPEHFARVTIKDGLKRKQLEKGIQQLVDEGFIQLFSDPKIGWQDSILGVVGVLQFEVLQYRLKDEYGVDSKIERLPFGLARWPKQNGKACSQLKGGLKVYQDLQEEPVVLLEREWNLTWLQKENPDVEFAISSST